MTKKIELITGGVGGIGTGISKILAEKGYFVVANYVVPGSETRWQDEMASVGFNGGCSAVAFGDVSDYEATGEMIRNIEADHGPISVLVNCAGMNRRKPIEQVSELRDSLHDALTRTNEILRSLKRQRKQSRLVETTLHSLRQLQTVA